MNRFLKHTGAKYPIVQAPMGWIARSQLASARIRALKTERTAKIYEDGLMPADIFKGIKHVYFGGDMEASIGLAGQSSGLIDAVKTAKQIIEETVEEFFTITERMGAFSAAQEF